MTAQYIRLGVGAESLFAAIRIDKETGFLVTLTKKRMADNSMLQIRHHRTTIVAIASVLLWLTGVPVSAQIGPWTKSNTKVGVKLGMLYSSHFRVDGVSNETGIGISGGVVFDIPVVRRVISGLTLDLHDIHVFEARKKLLDISLPVKYVFAFPEQHWELRPMMAAGFGYLTQVDFLERTTYLTIKGGLEAVFHTDTRYSLILDFLVLSMPTGGNRDNKVTYGPTLIIRGGFIY
jgi:hypothetical protein